MGCQKKCTGHCQDNGSDLFFCGETVRHNAGECHNQHRTGVLEYGSSTAVGPVDCLLVAELAEHDAEDCEDAELDYITAVFPDCGHAAGWSISRGVGFCRKTGFCRTAGFQYIRGKTCQNHDCPCAEHAERRQVCRIHRIIFEDVLAAAAGKTPEERCNNGYQCAVFAVFCVHVKSDTSCNEISDLIESPYKIIESLLTSVKIENEEDVRYD